MRKNKTIKAVSFALISALLLSGCGENASEVNEITERTSDTAAQAQITVNTEGEKETTAEDNTTTETTEEETTETDPEDLPPDESLFEYYDLLNEEFQKYGVTTPISFYGDFYFSSKENTIVIPKSNLGGIFTYNIENKMKKAFKYFENSYNAVVCNDILYSQEAFWWNEQEIYVHKYNGDFIYIDDGQRYTVGFTFMGEDELWDSIKYTNYLYAQPDGTVFLDCQVSSDSNILGTHGYFMISSDYETLTMLPKPTIEVEHGFTEERDFSILACYNNKLFVNADDIGFCCIDTNNLTWEKLDFSLDEEGASYCKSVGRYLLFNHTIYDMETKEVLVHNENFPVNFSTSYYGGKYNVAIKNKKWYFYRCASDGSYVDLKYYESYDLGDQSSSKCTPITDKYYIYEDNYGYFLRAYETGEQWEETIYLKDDSGNIIYEE